MEKNILVTGGLGFIGSHVVIKLLENNHKVIIIDNLSNSELTTLDKIKHIVQEKSNNLTFVEGDITIAETLHQIFNDTKIDCVFHFSALKSVSESEKYPEQYYYNNVFGTIQLLDIMKMYKCNNFIYSSSATVYGSEPAPVCETMTTGNDLSCNYAKNKHDVEQYIINNCNDCKIVILRYFNPIGSHKSGLIGENPNGIPNNIFPYLLRVARQVNQDVHDSESPYDKLTVFGNDYETSDGTCIRDYIHIDDLAHAHINAFDYLNQDDTNINIKESIFNVGTGNGTSVLELINTMNNVLVEHNKKTIPYEIGTRRVGDLAISYANVDKIEQVLGFKTCHDIKQMCHDGLTFIGLI